MTCREWEERVATAARDGAPDTALYQHLASCAHCLRFAGQMAAVAEALAGWGVPASDDAAAEAARAALVERLAALRQPTPEQPTRHSALRLAEQPAAIAIAGAAAMAAGAFAAPGWIRWVLVCWATLAALAITLVLFHHGRPETPEGEY